MHNIILIALASFHWKYCRLFVYTQSATGRFRLPPEGLKQFAGRQSIVCISLHFLPPTEDFLFSVSFSDLIVTVFLGFQLVTL